MKKMQGLPLELVKPGMKLVKSVKNDRGMTLCGAGVVLTEALIARLSDMGIKRITVEGHPTGTNRNEQSLGQQIDALNARFRYVEEDPLMRKVKHILLEFFKQKAGAV
jgi:hypothetical protein